MESFPLSIQTTYQDLLEARRAFEVAELGGAPLLKEVSGRAYWYARQRVGGRIVDRYLGADTPELRARIDRAGDAAAIDRRCASMVAQLRAAGVPSLDRETGKVLAALARTGVFRLGGTLIGTHAFRLYAAELGVRFPTQLGVTSDIDIAAFENLKLVVGDTVDPTLAAIFAALRLEPAPGLDPKGRPTRWAMPTGGATVEFLAPRMREKEGPVLLEPLGVYAQPLSFLNYLIGDPIAAVGLYRSGVLLQIPRPERFAVHKLIVAGRRRRDEAAKAKKDLAQARVLLEILADDRPEELAAAYEDAADRGPAWRKALEQARARDQKIAAMLASLG